MAFRIETASCALVVFLAAQALAAAEATAVGAPIAIRHRHLHGGAAGTLVFTTEGLTFNEPGKKHQHSRSWSYAEIQLLDAGPAEIHIRTYEDMAKLAGRDREFNFDRVPDNALSGVVPFLTAHLDQRFISRFAEPPGTLLWQAPAKLLHRTTGVNGTFEASANTLVFRGARPGESRTWRYSDVQNLSTAGDYELSITSLDGVTRFQLKQALPEDRFNDLWRRISEANGLHAIQSRLENHHE